MTRQEFDRNFAASQDSTEGYTSEQLAEANEYVFAEVSDQEFWDTHTKSLVDNLFAQKFGQFIE